VKIGLISDTHGLLRGGVFDHFAGVELILHAGDIGSLDLLTELEAVAPVIAVYGNTDDFEVRDQVEEVAALELEGRHVVLIHGDQFGSPTPRHLREAFPGADIIVYGHTHRPLVDRGGGALVVNPGAAGPRRFELLPTLGLLTISSSSADDSGVEVEIVELKD